MSGFPHDYMDVAAGAPVGGIPVGGIPLGGIPSRCGVPIRRIGVVRHSDPTLRAIAE